VGNTQITTRIVVGAEANEAHSTRAWEESFYAVRAIIYAGQLEDRATRGKLRFEGKYKITDLVVGRALLVVVMPVLHMLQDVGNRSSREMASFIQRAAHLTPLLFSEGLIEVGGKLKELVGKDRLIPVQQEERHILDCGIVESPVSEDNIGQHFIPVGLVALDVHGQKVTKGLVHPFRDASSLGPITRTEHMSG
jgi:hypothetical protein